jgi:hypothetical protein
VGYNEAKYIISIPGRFYCCVINFEVIHNDRRGFPLMRLTIFQVFFIGVWLLSLKMYSCQLSRLPYEALSLHLQGPEVIQVIVCSIGFELCEGCPTFIDGCLAIVIEPRLRYLPRVW